MSEGADRSRPSLETPKGEAAKSGPHETWTDLELLIQLAEGCEVHGAGFICRHRWEDVEGSGAVDRNGLEGARERLAAAALKVLTGSAGELVRLRDALKTAEDLVSRWLHLGSDTVSREEFYAVRDYLRIELSSSSVSPSLTGGERG